MLKTRTSSYVIVAVGVCLAVAIFVNDLLSPLGVASGVPYIVLFLMSWWLPQRRLPVLLGVVCTMLTVLGMLLSSQVGVTWDEAMGRVLAIVAIWMTAVLCLRSKRAEIALENAHAELERTVARRTAHLSEANAQLKKEVAQRKRMEEALRASEQQHAKAQQIAHLGHWQYDFESDQLSWSRETARILGLEFSDAQPEYHALMDVVHGDDRGRFGKAIEAARSAGQPVDLDMRIVRPDGQHRWVHAVAEVRPENARQASRLAGTIHDVTDRKLAEEQIHRQQEALAHLGRVGTIGEMTAGIAHELNQPLTSIVNYTRGCIRRIDDGSASAEEMTRVLSEVADEAGRAGEIIRRMRRFVRKQEGTQTAVDLGEVVQQSVSLMTHELQALGIDLRLEFPDHLPAVFADRVELQQVILNLLRNSMEAIESSDGSARQISIVGRVHSADTVVMLISDTGCGLPQEGAQRIFEPFFTTKSHGMGMGLGISRTIVEAGGGHLRARASTGTGCTFELVLPTAASKEAEAHRASDSAGAAGVGAGKNHGG